MRSPEIASQPLTTPPSRVRLRRLALGLTQAQAASLAGLSREQVSKVERGHADSHVSTWQALARALNCPVGDLLEDDERPAGGPGAQETAGQGRHESAR